MTSRTRIFMTGASGYIGSVITEFAIAEGYEVYGLSRTEKSDVKLTSLGAVPIWGDLHSLDVLRRESAQAQIVLHLADAYVNNWGMDYNEVLRIDAAAVDAIGDSLQGTLKPLVTTSGTLMAAPDPNGAETTESSPPEENPVVDRIRAEQHALSLSKKGIRVCVIRLAPFVYGRGGSGIRLFMQMFMGNGEATYINDGNFPTSTVHVDDAARLYLLTAQKAKSGEIFNCTSATDVTLGQITKAVAECLHLPVRSLTLNEMIAKAGDFFARFLSLTNRASSAKAVKELGWQPKEMGVLEDIKSGSYLAVAEELQKGEA